jgi:hypothetical protein
MNNNDVVKMCKEKILKKLEENFSNIVWRVESLSTTDFELFQYQKKDFEENFIMNLFNEYDIVSAIKIEHNSIYLLFDQEIEVNINFNFNENGIEK